MSGKLFICCSLIVVAGLLVSGCCGCCIPTDPGTPDTPGNIYSGPGTRTDIDSDLVGAWGDSGTMGSLVDSAGNYVGAAYSGQAYRFNSDGTYMYRIIGSGTIIKGLVEVHGKYRVSGDQLYLYDNKESFYPFAGEKRAPTRDEPGQDETYKYWFEDGTETLALRSIDSDYVERFHRAE
ncbi:hypothetical protein [Methanocella sp. MCL-LM]|uniref:hypothetical protein n=1 Tax=Methanocella sp. MCL-LM TaxID=3412035 RepID=UPI003C781F79